MYSLNHGKCNEQMYKDKVYLSNSELRSFKLRIQLVSCAYKTLKTNDFYKIVNKLMDSKIR